MEEKDVPHYRPIEIRVGGMKGFKVYTDPLFTPVFFALNSQITHQINV